MNLSVAAFLVILSQACAFTMVSPARTGRALFAAEYAPMEGEGKINLKVRPPFHEATRTE